MVKTTKKTHTKRFFAFSLTETLILLTVLGIAIASLTPMISRKIVNNAEGGVTPSGGSQSRY